MGTRSLPPWTAGFFASAIVLGACWGCNDGDRPLGVAGAAGTAGTGTAGRAGTTGTAGSVATAGAAGAASAAGGAGAVGTAGAGGMGGSGGAAGPAGAAGTDGGAGVGGAGGAGVAGITGTAGMTGTAGTAGAAGATTANPSLGCGMMPGAPDSSNKLVKHNVMVTGVDPAFIAAFTPNAGSQYTWTMRNYFLRLPVGYAVDKPYPVDLSGTGCGGGETVGADGYYALPAVNAQTEAIQVGLSYVTSQAATPNCREFADDFVNSPEPQYLDAVIDDISAKYCVDKNKIFVNGYESGAQEAILSGCNNPDKVRAYGVQIGGGLRIHHPPCMAKPAAAMFVVGLMDMFSPIGPLTTPQNDSFGLAPARDEQLMRNGCVGNATAQWNATFPKCMTFTGCPAKFPVVWCPLEVNEGAGPNPMGSDGGAILASYRLTAMWQFFNSLPPE